MHQIINAAVLSFLIVPTAAFGSIDPIVGTPSGKHGGRMLTAHAPDLGGRPRDVPSTAALGAVDCRSLNGDGWRAPGRDQKFHDYS